MEMSTSGGRIICLLVCVLSLGLAAAPVFAQGDANPAPAKDKFERYNRTMTSFNDTMDRWFLKPIATLYDRIVPKPLNRGIHNIYLNFSVIDSIANDALQLHFAQLLNDCWRLTINTTLGVGGLFDLASRMQLPYYANDFGLTLAHYGYVNSAYFVVPFWGPSTLRDTISMPIDYMAFEIYPWINPRSKRYAVYALGVIDRRVQLLEYQPLFEAAAIDKYSFLRNAYLQRRAYQIQQNSELGMTGRANMPEPEPVQAVAGQG